MTSSRAAGSGTSPTSPSTRPSRSAPCSPSRGPRRCAARSSPPAAASTGTRACPASPSSNGTTASTSPVLSPWRRGSPRACPAPPADRRQGRHPVRAQTDRPQGRVLHCSDGQWIAVNWTVPDDWSGREHHAAGVFDAAAGTLTLYVDGAARATRTTDRRPTSNTAPLSLASDADNQTREFDGTIRRARVYARALTAAELASDDRGPGDDGVRFWFDAATVRTERKRAEATSFLAYGGDWGDNPNDGAFVADGIVTADRKLGGKAAEVKRVYQAVGAVRTSDGGPGAVTLTNEYLFTNLRAFDGRWELVADGEVIGRGRIGRDQLDVTPLSQKRVELPVRLPRDPAPGTEFFLQLSFTTRERTPWSEAGFEVARHQLPLDADTPAVVPFPCPASPRCGTRRVTRTSASRARASRSPWTAAPASSPTTRPTAPACSPPDRRPTSGGRPPTTTAATASTCATRPGATRAPAVRSATSPYGRSATAPSRSASPAPSPPRSSPRTPRRTPSSATARSRWTTPSTRAPRTCRTSRRSARCCSCPAAWTGCTGTGAAPRRTTGTATPVATWAVGPPPWPSSGRRTSGRRRTATRPTCAGWR